MSLKQARAQQSPDAQDERETVALHACCAEFCLPELRLLCLRERILLLFVH